MSSKARIWAVVAVAVVIGLVADTVLDAKTAGLTMVTGFAGCVLLIIGSKNVVGRVLQRPESYYADVAERTADAAHEVADDG
ncbi:MAG: hypothetical protein JJU45_10800 [Acidimicrobiia bacterium]|nr:hypothetical protein [Acidimicrobiia bacterium]